MLGHVLVLFGFVQDPENPLPYFIMTFIGGGSGLVAPPHRAEADLT